MTFNKTLALALVATAGAALSALPAKAQSAATTAITGADFSADMEAAIPVVIGALIVLVGFRMLKRVL